MIGALSGGFWERQGRHLWTKTEHILKNGLDWCPEVTLSQI